MDLKFQVFGSGSSVDLDCMVFLEGYDTIPSNKESSDLCQKYSEMIAIYTGTDKPVNTNIAILRDGIVAECYKGTPDEVNNSLCLTYQLHKQYYPLQLDRLSKRDVELKILRTLRVILSFLSRSEHRKIVKKALKADVYAKIGTLAKIDLSKVERHDVKVSMEDYHKVIAFQLGQTIALLRDIELYTKEGIGGYFPELKKMLDRKEHNGVILERYKKLLLSMISKRKFQKIEE